MKTVISCSRRTDIPAFYYDWLQTVLKEKKVVLYNEYSQKNYTVDLEPENTHSIVLWSKNFAHLLKDEGLLANYNLYFQFTITGYSKILEPNVIDKEEGVRQIIELSKKYSPDQINWRYDPLIFDRTALDNSVEERLNTFKWLCKRISNAGITRCTISFATFYGGVEKKLWRSGFKFLEPSIEFQKEFAGKLIDIASKNNIQLYTCANPLIESVPGLLKGHCVDGELLTSLFGEKATKAHDTAQREACGCTRAKDIGKYSQRCFHSCTYCYSQVSNMSKE